MPCIKQCGPRNIFFSSFLSPPVLIDKDHSPQWNPGHIKDVTASKVDWYFSPLDAKRELTLS